MTALLYFVNQNSGAIQVVFSGIVTLATLIYAVLTWKLVSETRRMRKAQTDAKVTVGIRLTNRQIGFHFMLALDIAFASFLDQSFQLFGTDHLGFAPKLHHPTHYLKKI